MDRQWVDDVLNFWFKELTAQDWYAGGAELDDKIRSRFQETYERVKTDFDIESADDPRTALAAIILFDQMPRNMFRKTAAAFGTDDLAIAIARRAVDQGLDNDMKPEEKQFLYMPFMHSEVSADQERCVDLIRMLGSEEGLKYAIEHRDIVAAYGRFPHRNRVLGRESTPAEVEFLKSHDGYGQ